MSAVAKKATEAEGFELMLDGYRAGKQLGEIDSLTSEQKIKRRRFKRALQARRSEILQQIEDLNAERCIKCHKQTIGPAEKKLGCQCWAAVNIRNLSEELDRLARLGKPTEQEGDDEVAEAKKKPTKAKEPAGKAESNTLELTRTIEDLKAKTERLEKENAALLLKANDYERLAEDYRSTTEENERLARMLDRLKDTAQMNVWLMRQHIGFVEQLEEVTP